MKKLNLFFAAVLLLSFIGCNNNDEIELKSIEGTYIGSLKSDNLSKSSSVSTTNEFTGDIRIKGNQLEFHCFGEDIDITMMLDYFEDNGNFMVCLTGNDYANLYGHKHGEGMMSAGGMNHMNSGNTDWTKHLNSSHDPNEHHFNSGFDMNNRTFNCTFQWMGETFTFAGVKE
jgi:uncharacterized lipoprotein NlpE involved in copper resistance